MKLRFRENSVRLRLNRREVADLASGNTLKERIEFPGNNGIAYVLEPSARLSGDASFRDGTIRVSAPQTLVTEWAGGDLIGLYFELPVSGAVLKVAIEKDLECAEGELEERDPDAFPRASGKNC